MTSATKVLAVLVLGCSAGTCVQAATVYLTPAAQTVGLDATTASFDLMMDFATSEATLGGGIDIDVTGVASFAGFAPSSYFLTVADPAFTGFGSLHADADYEVHLGSFGGLSGLNRLGTITLQFNQALVPGATAAVALAVNSFWGGFYSATTGAAMPVTMANGLVTAVPEPQAAALLLAGLGLVGAAGRRARRV